MAPIYILGGGIAGLIMGHALSKQGIEDYIILEASPDEESLIKKSHIYYIHEPIEELSHLLIKKRIQSWVFANGAFHERPTPLMCNEYAQRITNKTLATAIHHIDGTQKWGYFPESGDLSEIIRFYLKEQKGKIFYGQWIEGLNLEKKIIRTQQDTKRFSLPFNIVISTLPLPLLLAMCKYKPEVEMGYSKIVTYKMKALQTQDIYQELYIPSVKDSPFYRMLLYNDTIITEATGDISHPKEFVKELKEKFGVESEGKFQRYELPSGRFIPIDDQVRKRWIRKMTDDHNIMSFGRYGTWSYKRTDHLPEDAKQLIEIIKAKGMSV